MTNRRRRQRPVTAPETLEVRALLTTAGMTIAEFLHSQGGDYGHIQGLVDSGDLSQRDADRLTTKLDKADAALSSNRSQTMQSALDDYSELLQRYVTNGKLDQKTATKLERLELFDRDGSDHDILRRVAVDAGSMPLLNRMRASYTTFAPTDRAFIELAQDLGLDSDEEPKAYDKIVDALTSFRGNTAEFELNRLMEYHLLREELTFTQVVKADSIETFGGRKIRPKGRVLRDVDTDLQDARLNRNRSDIPVKNGVVHTINRVMIPVDLVKGQTITEQLSVDGIDPDRRGGDFDIFMQLATGAGLDGMLDDASADFTAFAPTDRAFVAFAGELGFAGSSEAGALNTIVNTLTQGQRDDIVRYHVLDGAMSVQAIKRGRPLQTIQGGTIQPRGLALRDADPEITDASIVRSRSDIPAENGVIHVVDAVLLPEDLTTQLTIGERLDASGGVYDGNRGDFDILLNAVTMAGLDAELRDPASDLTVFAPTDNAFITLAQELGYNGLDEQGSFNTIIDTLTTLGGGDPVPMLRDILLYHVTAGTRTVSQLRAAGSVTTLQGSSLEVRPRRLVDNDPNIADGDISRRRNILAENGMIHVVTRVLLPSSL